MTEFESALLEELRAMRVGVEAVVTLLSAPAAPSAADAAPCTHPEEARVNFSGQGTVEWECRLCGARYEARLSEAGAGDDSSGADVCTAGE